MHYDVIQCRCEVISAGDNEKCPKLLRILAKLRWKRELFVKSSPLPTLTYPLHKTSKDVTLRYLFIALDNTLLRLIFSATYNACVCYSDVKT